MSLAGYFGNRVDVSQRFGNMHHLVQLRARSEKGAILIHSVLAAVGNRYHAQLRAGLLAQHLPRHDIGMMFHTGDKDFVAFFQRRPPPAIGPQIDGLGSAARKDDFLAARSEEHTSELQSLMRISYSVFCLKNKTKTRKITRLTHHP